MPALDFPASPTDGQVYANWVYSTSKGAWQAKPLVSEKTVTADVPPLNPADGDQWFSTIDGVLYVYVVDVDGGQWVESRSAIISDGYYSPNYIINGAIEINQRNATSLTNQHANFLADRWQFIQSGGTSVFSVQQFATGSSILVGYEAANYLRMTTSGQSAAGDYTAFQQPIEDVRALAGKTVTISFWARSASGTPSIAIEMAQNFGNSPGSAELSIPVAKVACNTTWTRYSATVTLPTIAGKTIGTNNSLKLKFWTSAGTTYASATNSLGIQSTTIDFWGIQVEEGSVATPFRRNANSLQGELAACQRYYFRINNVGAATRFVTGIASNASNWSTGPIITPVPMRIVPTVQCVGTFGLSDGSAVAWIGNGNIFSNFSVVQGSVYPTIFTGSVSGLTAFRTYNIESTDTNSKYVEFNAEL